MNNEENNCPLSTKDWILFLSVSGEISNLENKQIQRSNNLNATVAVLTSVMAIIISSMFLTAKADIPQSNKVIIFDTFYYAIIILIIVYFYNMLSFLYEKFYSETKKNADNLKNIRNDIIDGSLKDTNEIRERWRNMRNMSFSKKIKDSYNKLIDNVNLNTEKKSKLIELLILVVSILAALQQLHGIFLAWFTIFIFASIYYYITIQNDASKPNIFDKIVTAIIAGSFSGLLNVNIVIAFYNSLSVPILKMLYGLYYVVLAFMLYIALIKR